MMVITYSSDGGCWPNPGPMRMAISYVGTDGKRVALIENLVDGTSNRAEWCAMLWAMEHALDSGHRKVEFIADSRLVINQANGRWKIKDEWIKTAHRDFLVLRSRFDRATFRWIGRDHNPAGVHLENVPRSS